MSEFQYCDEDDVAFFKNKLKEALSEENLRMYKLLFFTIIVHASRNNTTSSNIINNNNVMYYHQTLFLL